VFALTLQAKELWYDDVVRRVGKGDEMAALLDEALEIDPRYTPAMVWMVYANWLRRQDGLIDSEEENALWLKLAGRILAIEPDNASVHNLFAWEALYIDRDLQAAASSYARALSSAPNDAEILRQAARFAFLIGRKDDALAIIDRSMVVDPLCSLCLYGASRIYMYADRLDRAVALRQRFLALHDQGHYEFGIMKLLQGEAAEALVIFRDLERRMALPKTPNDGRAHVGLAMAFHDLGQHEESDEQLAIFVDNYGEQYPREVAKIHAWRNEKDQAFEWFHRAEGMAGDSEGMLVANPAFRNLHGDPRWTAILETRGLSTAQLATLEFPIGLLSQFRGE
jgi:tetratricopeptide (TPR) repeat protein